jgi:hypothetical protein
MAAVEWFQFAISLLLREVGGSGAAVFDVAESSCKGV